MFFSFLMYEIVEKILDVSYYRFDLLFFLLVFMGLYFCFYMNVLIELYLEIKSRMIFFNLGYLNFIILNKKCI